MKSVIENSFVVLDVSFDTKEEAIAALAERFWAAGRLNDKEKYIRDVLQREESMSTAVGFLIATPHAKSEAVAETSVGFLRLNKPILWDGEEDARLVFQLAVSAGDCANRHLQILAALSRKLAHEEFRESLMRISQAETLVEMMGKL